MGDTAMNVPVKVRTHEIDQLHEFLPFAIGEYEQAELDEQAEEVQRIYEEHVEGNENRGTVSMPVDDWQTVLRTLDRVDDGLRADWLTDKLLDRLQRRVEAFNE